MAHHHHHHQPNNNNMYGHPQQAHSKNHYPPPHPGGGNYYHQWSQQPEYHHHPSNSMYQQPPPPPPGPPLHHYHHHQQQQQQQYPPHHLPPLPPPPPPPPHMHHSHGGYHHQQQQQQQFPMGGYHGGMQQQQQQHHHHQPYPTFVPPPLHSAPSASHHHHHHNHNLRAHSMDDHEEGEVMDDDDLDPIEVLHPERTLLAPPPEVLPPLIESTTSNHQHIAARETPVEESIPEDLTSPCKRVVCKQSQEDDDDDDDNNVAEGDVSTINAMKRESKFVNGIFREPKGKNSKTKEDSNLCSSKSTDTTDTTTTLAMGKPYYDTNRGGMSSNTSTTDALIHQDEDAFLNSNNSSSYSEVDTTIPLKQVSDAENTVSVYLPQSNVTSDKGLNDTTTSLVMDSKGDTLAINHQKKTIVATPKDAENEPPLKRNNEASSTAGAKRCAVMSPIAMCFNQMLGAAEYIKTPAVPKRRSANTSKPLPLVHPVEKKREVPTGPNPFDELAADPELERLVILQMAMQRQQHGNQYHPHGTTTDKVVPSIAPRSRIISEGFFWREYPACEQVLYNHMTRYYEISAIQRNYKTQQAFNNILVDEVRQAAIDSGFEIDPNFDDKKLRDRIRCFYKTHLQNAKKRLATLQKHSELEENRSLVAVFIRCVRDPSLTLEESLDMAKECAASKKQRRLDKVEKLKLSVKLHEANNSAVEGTTAV